MNQNRLHKENFISYKIVCCLVVAALFLTACTGFNPSDALPPVSDEASVPAPEPDGQSSNPSTEPSEEDCDEFTAIRRQIAYEGLKMDPIACVLETDDTGMRLAEYLSLLRLTDGTVSSLDDISMEHRVWTSVVATKHYETSPDSDFYRPELKPFEEASRQLLGFTEEWFWLKEHVEESARLLYGQDVELAHQGFSKYRYLDPLGVYTPPHMEAGSQTLPVIFEYEDMGEWLYAEVGYVISSRRGYSDPTTWEEIPQEQLKEYVETKLQRYQVTVRKVSKDWFLLECQTPIDSLSM